MCDPGIGRKSLRQEVRKTEFEAHFSSDLTLDKSLLLSRPLVPRLNDRKAKSDGLLRDQAPPVAGLCDRCWRCQDAGSEGEARGASAVTETVDDGEEEERNSAREGPGLGD